MDDWLAWDLGPATTASRVAAVGLAGVLVVTILGSASGGPEWLRAWRIATIFLLYAGALIAGRHLFTADPGERTRWGLVSVRIALLAALLAVVYQSGTPGVGFGVDRVSEAVGIVGVVVAFCVLADDPLEYSQKQWLVLWCFAALAAVFFYHGLDVAEASPRSRQPLWSTVVAGVCLAVLPRYLPRELFLWVLSRVAAVVVLLGVATYAVGEYSLLGIQFRFHGAFAAPVVGTEVPAIRSLFVNRNALAVVATAGLVAAVSELHRAYAVRVSYATLVAPAALLSVNAIGFVLSYSRALWAIGAVAIGLYLAFVLAGRDAVPAATVTASTLVLGGLLAAYVAVRTGLLTSDPTDRFHLWRASADAILDRPSMLGEGMISTSEHIVEYRDGADPASPHSSYLTIWIQGGFVGGLAYLVLHAASLTEGTRRYRVVDVGALALAFTFVAHQLFESYTLLSWRVASVVASMAVGFLVFGRDREAGSVLGQVDESSAERSETGAKREESTPREPSAGVATAGDVSGEEGAGGDPSRGEGSSTAGRYAETSGENASPPVPSGEESTADDGPTPPAPSEEEPSEPAPFDDGESSPPVPADEDATEDSRPVPADEDATEDSRPVPADEDPDSEE